MVLCVSIVVGVIGFKMIAHYHGILSEAEKARKENGSSVTPANQEEDHEEDLKKLGFGKLADHS